MNREIQNRETKKQTNKQRKRKQTEKDKTKRQTDTKKSSEKLPAGIQLCLNGRTRLTKLKEINLNINTT
jgi:hypothetical protein